MKYKTFILTFTVIAASLITSNVHSQNPRDTIKVEAQRKDSIDAAMKTEARVQETKDENTIARAKADRKETKAKANNARRIERDAENAAKESEHALRSERKAQKSRRQANEQAEKASKAREKSDKN
jgi:hypothetical protein